MKMPLDPTADNALLARMKLGDEDAFVALYRRHKDAVYRFALMYCGAASHAADVTQDTFIHLISRPDQFDAGRGSIGAWLCGVARMLSRKHLGEREIATDPQLLADDTDP